MCSSVWSCSALGKQEIKRVSKGIQVEKTWRESTKLIWYLTKWDGVVGSYAIPPIWSLSEDYELSISGWAHSFTGTQGIQAEGSRKVNKEEKNEEKEEEKEDEDEEQAKVILTEDKSGRNGGASTRAVDPNDEVNSNASSEYWDKFQVFGRRSKNMHTEESYLRDQITESPPSTVTSSHQVAVSEQRSEASTQQHFTINLVDTCCTLRSSCPVRVYSSRCKSRTVIFVHNTSTVLLILWYVDKSIAV